MGEEDGAVQSFFGVCVWRPWAQQHSAGAATKQKSKSEGAFCCGLERRSRRTKGMGQRKEVCNVSGVLMKQGQYFSRGAASATTAYARVYEMPTSQTRTFFPNSAMAAAAAKVQNTH